MDTVHEGLLLAYEYKYLILKFGEIPNTSVDVNATVQLILNTLLSVPVQLFFSSQNL